MMYKRQKRYKSLKLFLPFADIHLDISAKETFLKKAFTLIELVFVIIIVGILSAILAPSPKMDTLQEAADQIASHIRYTQRLALHDDKFNPKDRYWYRGRWQIIFAKSSSGTRNSGGYWAYTIFSDRPNYGGRPDPIEIAKNPLNSKQLLTGGYANEVDWKDKRATKSMNIGSKYGIISVQFLGGCKNSQRISFDYLGRPLSGNLKSITNKYGNKLIKTKCNIKLNTSTESKIITIEPETGYVYIN